LTEVRVQPATYLIDVFSLELSGLRLADKRSLPCPRRSQWLEARDDLYEQIMQKAWNPEKKFFAQSFDEIHILDSAVLIMPLVFFSTAVSRFS
jgi:GH15 family glucan-1,4-alpha-glucosidase